MISLKWINVVLWAALGLSKLTNRRASVVDMKISYGVTWAVLMVNLVARALGV